MPDKQERLIHLLRALGKRAERATIVGSDEEREAAMASYPPMARMYNDYARQANELYGGELLTRSDEIELPEGDVDVPALMAELVLRASQLADELVLIQALDGGNGERVDWADALVRLEEAGIDTDNILEHLRRNIGPGGLVRKRWVDRLERLAEAGIDVDEVFPLLEAEGSFIDVDLTGSRSHRGRRHSRHRHITMAPAWDWTPEVPEAPEAPELPARYRMKIRRPEREPRLDERALEEAWKFDIINKVQKGELTPEEGAGLLEKGWPGDHEEDEESDE